MRQSVSFLLAFSFFLLPVRVCAFSVAAFTQDTQGIYGNDAKAIQRVLRKQQEAWNRHDLEGFMAGYWNSPEADFLLWRQRA